MAKKRGTAGASATGTRKAAKKKKSETTEMREAVLDLKMVPGEKIVHHMATVKGYLDKAATIQGSLRNAYKAAKADGVPKEVISYLLGLERGDAVVYRQEMEAIGVGLKAVGAPFQLNVFDTAYGSAVDQAIAEARAAAKAGRTAECRWPEGSKEHEAYMLEYQTIQAHRVPGADNLSEEEIRDAVTSSKPKVLEGADAVH